MKIKVGYWLTTGLFGSMMLASAVGYLSGAPQLVDAFRHLGYPDYFRSLLGVAKVLGVAALLLPIVPRTLREWAYAGFVINLVAAVVSHLAVGDGAGQAAAPVVALVLVLGSHRLWRRQAVQAADVEATSFRTPEARV